MAQHDYVIDNQSFPATRSDLNSLFQAIASNNSGATAPSTTYANQLWYDTANNKLYIRNEDNDAWIELFTLDQVNDKLASLNMQGGELILDADGDTSITADADDRIDFRAGGSDTAHVTSTDFLVGKTTTAIGTAGSRFISNGQIQATADGNEPFFANRLSSDGVQFDFRKDGISNGSIGSNSGHLVVNGTGAVELQEGGTTRVYVDSGGFFPWSDNIYDIGVLTTARFNDAFITNGVTTSSDQNEKQQIATLTDAEIAAAKRISNGFKTFKWNDAVAAKGDNARTHTGVIAQEVRTALEAEGLDAGNYAFLMSNTWWEKDVEVPAVAAVAEVLDDDGNVVTEAVEAQDAYTRTDTYDTAEEAPEGATERTRLGIRYPELLAFVGAATEQRLTSIEARLTALEA